MISALHTALSYLVDARSERLSEILGVRGTNERVEGLTLLCRDVLKVSTLAYVDGDLCFYDGSRYVGVAWGVVVSVLSNVLVESGCSPLDVRRMGDMPMLVLSEKVMRSSGALCFTNGVMTFTPWVRFTPEFSPKVVVREVLPFAYDADAGCPLWDAFLKEVLPDESVRMVLQEFFGMCFVDRTYLSVEKGALFVGRGANGKSVIFEVIKRVLGEENVSTLDSSQLIDEKMIPYVKGKRLNFSPDVRRSAELDSALKALFSGQDVTGRRIYGDAEKIKCPPVVFAMNELPRFRDMTDGFFRRLLLFQFDVQIPPERQDRSLVGRICASDTPGIFNWILAGRKRLVRHSGEFTESPKMALDLERVRAEVAEGAFPVKAWLDRRGYSVGPVYPGQPFCPVSQNEIFVGLRGAVTRSAITRELSGFGVTSFRSKELKYRLYPKKV